MQYSSMLYYKKFCLFLEVALTMEEKQVKNIQSVHRAFEIWEYIIEGGAGYRLSEIAEHCNLNKTTTYHLLKTLESRGYVEKNFDTQNYKMGWKSFDVASQIYDNQNVVQLGRPYLEKLFQEFNETVLLCYCGWVKNCYMGTCFCQFESTNPLHTSIPVGTHLPLHCTAQGKLYLSNLSDNMLEKHFETLDMKAFTPYTITSKERLKEQLKDLKKKGYCIEREEYQEGVCTIAVPVLKYTGRVVSSIVVSLPVQRASEEYLQKIKDRMIPMSKELSNMAF